MYKLVFMLLMSYPILRGVKGTIELVRFYQAENSLSPIGAHTVNEDLPIIFAEVWEL